MKQKLATVFLMLLPLASSLSQHRNDSTFIITARKHALALYDDAMVAQARLYNGSRYRPQDHTLEEHPYFSSPDWIIGVVSYDGEQFSDVPLMYDISQGIVVTEHYPSGHPIALIDSKLHSFSIDGHNFEKIDNETVGNSLPHSGFYDVLYAGDTKVIARRQKTKRDLIVAREVERSFEERNRYFIFRNGVYFQVKSKKSVLKLMKDKKQELKKFLRQRKMQFAPNREKMLRILAEHYDTLR